MPMWASALAPECDAFVLGEVVQGLDVGQAVLGKDLAHGLALIVAVLDDEVAAVFEMGGGVLGEVADVLQAVCTVCEGVWWFEAQVALL